MENQKLSLGDLPVEVLLDNFLPFLPAQDILILESTNKYFSSLCNDDALWKRKLLDDFNFSGEGTARTTGYKFIYRGLNKPRVFVWGEKSNDRLGLGDRTPPQSVVSGVPYPIEVRLPGVRVVSLVASGMSFHALDSVGNVHVWGTLDGSSYASDDQAFSHAGRRAGSPHRLKMPTPIRSISCGRLHFSCLDIENTVWTFTCWGRPFYLSSPILKDPDYAPKQIECGWAFSALLTKSGEILVWWPFAGAMGILVDRAMRGTGHNTAYPEGNVIPCVPWDLDLTPTRLPSIPSLPDLPDAGGHEGTQKTQFIQIAAFDNHIVGLTNRGHVLKYGSLHSEADVHGRWEYLPKFSELDELKKTEAFSSSRVEVPGTLKITHISANFEHFVAYSTGSSSIVLLGDTETTPETQPKVIPELQNKSVISVVIGDYHNAALTSQGKLLTWGAYSNGALGLGDPAKLTPGTPGGFADLASQQFATSRGRGTPPAVERPSEVRFDHTNGKPIERFCFAVTAAGWHTGALVIDLEPGEEEEPETEGVVGSTADPDDDDPSGFVPDISEQPDTSRAMPFISIPGIFRRGFPAAFRG